MPARSKIANHCKTIMTILCPHCSQQLELTPEVIASLRGQPHFACPSCQGLIAVPLSHPMPRRRGAAAVQTQRGLNRNLLVLGVITLLVLGGIAALLAMRGSGNVFNTFNNVTNQIIHNSYFTQLIANGVTTMEDLKSIEEIRPFGDGFIGISKAELNWSQAREIAKRTGSEVLSIEDSATRTKQQQMEWLKINFSAQLQPSLWVQQDGQTKVTDGSDIFAASSLESIRKVALQWKTGADQKTNDPLAAAKEKLRTESGDDQRNFVESILSKSGTVEIWQGDRWMNVASPEDLPAGKIDLRHIKQVKGDFSDADAASMAACTKLVSMTLHRCSMDSIPFEQLTALEHVEIWNTKMTDAGFHDLPKCKKLRSVLIADAPVTSSILDTLVQCPELTCVSLTGRTEIRKGDFSRLASLKHITQLSIESDGTTSTENDLMFISKLPVLRELTLENFDLDDTSMAFLARCHILQKLRLGRSRFSAKAWANIAKVANIEHLDLWETEITDEMLRSISDHLNLKVLVLGGNPITGASLKTIDNLTSLTMLNLERTAITPEETNELRRALPACTILR
jgi:hypothetical protein